MDSVVVGKLGHGYPLRPVILVVVEEDPEVLLQLFVDMLRLSIRLRVEGSRGVVFDSKRDVECSHELGLELGSSVVDDLAGHSMEPEHLVSEYLGHAFDGECGVRRNCVHLLGKPVHYNADGVKAIRCR